LESLRSIAKENADDGLRTAADCSAALIEANAAPTETSYQTFLSQCDGRCCGAAAIQGIRHLVAEPKHLVSFRDGLDAAREGDARLGLDSAIELTDHSLTQSYYLVFAALIVGELAASESVDLQLDSGEWVSPDEIPVSPQLAKIARVASVDQPAGAAATLGAAPANDLLIALVRLRLTALPLLQKRRIFHDMRAFASAVNSFDFRQEDAAIEFANETSTVTADFVGAMTTIQDNALADVKTLFRRYNQELPYGQRLAVLLTLKMLDADLIARDEELKVGIAGVCGPEAEEELVELCDAYLR